MTKRVTIIINPVAGKEDSILWEINNAFSKKDISWDVQITHKKGEAYRLAQKAVARNEPIVAVYGGDGTVAEVARALCKTKNILCVIPGGTANVFAKELKIPTEIDQALALVARKSQKIKTIDMARFQNEIGVLRIETGLSTRIVKGTKRSTKRFLGPLAYLINLLPHLQDPPIYTFNLRMDDKQITASGIALMIANVGNIGIEGYSIMPQSKIDDGMLDVVLFKEKTRGSLFAWLQSTIIRKRPTGAIEYWKAKKVDVTLGVEQTIVCDDVMIRTKTIQAEIIPQALQVLVP